MSFAGKNIFLLFAFFLPSTLYASDFQIGIAQWSGYPNSIQGFKDGLAKHGVKEDKNVHFIYGDIGGDKALQARVAEQFSRKNLDLVYSLTTPGTVIMKEALSKDLPIVFSIVTYPADSGLIESFEYSGNNLVGTSNYISGRQYVKLLRLILPEAKSIAVFRRKGEPNSTIQSANMKRLFARKNIHVKEVEANSLEDLKTQATSLIGKVEVFMTTTDTLMQSGGEELLITLSREHKIPILSSNKAGIEKGSSFGPVSDFYQLGFMSGEKAASILLQNTPPKSLQTELQNPPLFLANKRVLQALGITLDSSTKDKISWVGD